MKDSWSLQDIMGDTSGYHDEFNRILRDNTFDVRKLPAVKEVRGKEDKQYWGIFIGFFVFFALAPALFLSSNTLGELVNLWAGSFAFGLVFLVIAFNKMRSSLRIEITKDKVRYEKKSLFSTTSWDESLSAYQGVLLTLWRSRNPKAPSCGLTLHHPHNEERSVKLWHLKWGRQSMDAWGQFARGLGKPTLMQTSKGIVPRDPPDHTDPEFDWGEVLEVFGYRA